jgi:integrase
VSPENVISEQLGHASVAFTLDVYSHVLPHVQDAAAENAQALLIEARLNDICSLIACTRHT